MKKNEILNRIVEKFVYTFTSLKFWALFLITVVSTYLLIIDKLTGTEWVTLITTIYTILFSIREVFKNRKTSSDNSDNDSK